MRKWIEFNVNHPKIVIVILCMVTVLAGYGFTKLYFDSSTEALMPKDNIDYKLGERVKEIFNDNKSFMLIAAESSKGEELLSYKVFSRLDNLVSELEEFKSFNAGLENSRLELLIKAGNISYTDAEKRNAEINKTKENAGAADIESELDKELLNGDKKSTTVTAGKQNNNDIWDLSKPVNKNIYVNPARERRIYNYEKYAPVRYRDIAANLDDRGIEQFKSILRYTGMNSLGTDHELSRMEFTKIMEAWETVYLYKSMEIIKALNNPLSGEDIQGTDSELKPVKLIEKNGTGKRMLPKTDMDFAEYREQLLKNPFFDSLYYSKDVNDQIRAFAISMTLRPVKKNMEIFRYFYQVIEKYNSAPLALTQVGKPILEKYINEYMQNDLKTFIPLVIFLVMLTLYLNFRSFRGVFLPILSILLGTFWTMGLVGLLNVPITLVVNMLIPLLVTIGSSYSIHIFNQYVLDRQMIENSGKKAGIALSVNHVSITVLLASLTTFVGFITLTVNDIVSLKDFGIFASIGVLFAMIISIMLIPSALALMKLLPAKAIKKSTAPGFVDRMINACGNISIKKAGPVVIISVIVTILFFFGVLMIKIESSPVYTFKKNSYVNQSDKRISNLFKGAYVMDLVIDSGKNDGIKDPEFLKMTEDIRAWIASPENRTKYLFLNTYSFGDIVKRMNMAMNGDKTEYFRIPDTEADIRDYLELYSGKDSDSDGRADSFEDFTDKNFRYLNILVRTGSYGDVIYSSSLCVKGQAALNEYMKNHQLAGRYGWKLLGDPINFTALSTLLAQGQVSNVLLSVLAVGIVVLFLFKNISAGLVSLIPIIISTIIVYGAMGFLGIPLDIPKTVLTSVAIGIGVDDTIHMLKNIRFNLLKGSSIRNAIIAAHKEGGVAIIYNSLAVGLGFSVLMLSNFKPVFYLGWLVVFIMITMTIGSLIVMPAAIIVFKLKLNRESKLRIFKIINFDRLFNEEK